MGPCKEPAVLAGPPYDGRVDPGRGVCGGSVHNFQGGPFSVPFFQCSPFAWSFLLVLGVDTVSEQVGEIIGRRHLIGYKLH